MAKGNTKEERDLIKRRFSRMYPNNNPLNDMEADTIVNGIKQAKMWKQLVEEENKFAVK